MNNSWGNGSGFVYFTNPSPNLNNSDFMAFSDPYGSPNCNGFSPVNYSSPGKYQKSPRNFYGRPPGRNSFRYHNSRDSNSFGSPNRSFNNSRNKSGHQHGKNNSFQHNGNRDVSKYYDHTSTRNPWAELEEKLKSTREAEAKAEKETADLEESSSSADEQESESETKTSSSELEEVTT